MTSSCGCTKQRTLFSLVGRRTIVVLHADVCLFLGNDATSTVPTPLPDQAQSGVANARATEEAAAPALNVTAPEPAPDECAHAASTGERPSLPATGNDAVGSVSRSDAWSFDSSMSRAEEADADSPMNRAEEAGAVPGLQPDIPASRTPIPSCAPSPASSGEATMPASRGESPRAKVRSSTDIDEPSPDSIVNQDGDSAQRISHSELRIESLDPHVASSSGDEPDRPVSIDIETAEASIDSAAEGEASTDTAAEGEAGIDTMAEGEDLSMQVAPQRVPRARKRQEANNSVTPALSPRKRRTVKITERGQDLT